jgi:hypothetical protein
MKKRYNKFLVISTFVILLGISYSYFSSNLDSNNLTPVANGSFLSSSLGGIMGVSSGNSEISSDISFLTTLVSLNKINIDTTLFTNKSFTSLKNNEVKIEPIGAGRINPFAPINDNNINNVSQNSGIITGLPTEITDKTVSLNGVINSLNGVTDMYFQYGTSEALGVVTSTVKQSLVGTFIKNVSGLTPKTAYFYKACAKVNGATLCGDMVSFNTN